MQRDLKVGLSLGVLVLGVVGALLFRREQVSETPKPTLKAAKEYDQRIAEGQLTPYMTGDLEFEADEPAAVSGKSRTGSGRPAHAVAPDWLNDDEDPFQVARQDNGQFDFNSSVDLGDPAAIPVQPRTGTKREIQAAGTAEMRTHVIQSGDSLSMLADRYLGNQGRYQEIYEANRDVLTDVNRLPLGATIVIPPATKTGARTASTQHNPLVPNSAGVAGTTPRTAAGQVDKARGKITDVSVLEPVAPPANDVEATADLAPISPPVTSRDKSAGESPTVTPKVQETKKFVTPSRLPFANQQNVKMSPPVRKPVTSEGGDSAAVRTNGLETNAEDADVGRLYQVRKGDSLEKIALKVYGNSRRAADIFAANRELLASPNAVREGQQLVLPE